MGEGSFHSFSYGANGIGSPPPVSSLPGAAAHLLLLPSPPLLVAMLHAGLGEFGNGLGGILIPVHCASTAWRTCQTPHSTTV